MKHQIQLPKSASRLLLATLALSVSVVFAACSPQDAMPESPKLEPAGQPEKISTNEAANFNPKVDILFVIDDSGSMGGEQGSLALNIPKFIGEIQKSSILDYHIGVTSSTYDSYARTNCGGNGRACGQGKLHGGDANVPFITRKTPNGLKILADNMILGTSGSALERFFSPVMAALSAPLVNGENAGFYRPDASLVVIFITDAEDQSTGVSSDDYLKFVWALKNGDQRKVLTYGAIIPVGAQTGNDCSRDEMAEPVELTAAISKSNGSYFDLCGTDYGLQLGLMAADLAQKVSKVLYLNRAPDLNSISVYFGTQKIENDLRNGWTYDASRNALVFGEDLVLSEQPEGTTLTVNFNAAQYK